MLKPINDKILVKPDTPQEATDGGILLPDSAQKKGCRGTVLAMGYGKERAYPSVLAHQGTIISDFQRTRFVVREGNTVVYPNYSGHEVEHDGQKYLVLTEDDILAIVE